MRELGAEASFFLKLDCDVTVCELGDRFVTIPSRKSGNYRLCSSENRVALVEHVGDYCERDVLATVVKCR